MLTSRIRLSATAVAAVVRLSQIPRSDLAGGTTLSTYSSGAISRRCLATAAPAASKPVPDAEGEDKKKKKKEIDPNKELSYKLLDRDSKIDTLATLILDTPDEKFNDVNTAVGIYRFGRLLSNDKDDINWERTKATQKLLKLATKHSFDPRSCANMCFGAAVARLDIFDEVLANQFLMHIAKDQSPRVPKYTPKQLTVIGWSFAMLQSKEDGFLKQVFNEASTRQAKDFDIKDLPKLLWAMGRSQIKDAALMEAISKFLASSKLEDLEPNDLSGLVWGLGKLQLKNDVLMKNIVDEIVENRKGFEAAGFSLQSMARLMWGLAAMPYKDDRIIASVMDVTSRRARFLRPESRKDLTFAMWTLGVKEFEQQLAKSDAEVEARKKKAEDEKEKYLKRIEARAADLAEKRQVETPASSKVVSKKAQPRVKVGK